jgi:hypothetical protein
MEARILRPLLWFGLLEYSSENFPDSLSGLTNHIQKSSILEIIGVATLAVADENAPYHHANRNQ